MNTSSRDDAGQLVVHVFYFQEFVFCGTARAHIWMPTDLNHENFLFNLVGESFLPYPYIIRFMLDLTTCFRVPRKAGLFFVLLSLIPNHRTR
jgi:hypothetical protein